MIYKILADSVVLIHFLWILFLFFGALWGAKNKIVKGSHVVGLAYAFVIQLFDWYCPLTHIEVWLRSKHDPALTYSGSFIPYYLEKVVYLELSRFVVFLLTIFLCGFNLWVYLKKKK